MKKGLLALVVVVLASFCVLSFSAEPEMWGIPDIIIGDQEDIGVTDNWFVFTDAFEFDEYYHWITTGNEAGLMWHYTECVPISMIAINRSTESAFADISATSDFASFRNLAMTPWGGPSSLNPPGWVSTDVAIVTLQVDNFLVIDEQDITVYSIDGSTDGLTNQYARNPVLSVTFPSAPADWFFIGYTGGPAPGMPFGIRPCDEEYNATSDALALITTGFDNDFGFWQQSNGGTDAPVDIVEGNAYIFTAWTFALPLPDNSDPKYIPWIRCRVNTANETVVQEMDINSLGAADAEVTTDPANATSETMVFDPRDHSNFASEGLAKLFFSFDMVDFQAANRAYPGELDDEGLVGLVGLDIERFPQKMMGKESVPGGTVWPDDVAVNFYGMLNRFDSLATGFGAQPPVLSTDTAGNLQISANNVSRGFAYYQLMNIYGEIMDADYWYRLRFSATSTNQDVPKLRFRVFAGDSQRSVNYNIQPTGDWNGYQLPGLMGTKYNVYFVPKAEFDGAAGNRLIWVFDFIDFSADHGNVSVSVSKVEVTAFTPPI